MVLLSLYNNKLSVEILALINDVITKLFLKLNHKDVLISIEKKRQILIWRFL
jgi:hypothetical protein